MMTMNPSRKIYDCYFSFHRGKDELKRDNTERSRKICVELQNRGLTPCFQDEKSKFDILAVESSKCAIIFITAKYMKKINSSRSLISFSSSNLEKLEFEACIKKKAQLIIPVVMEEAIKDSRCWKGKK